MEKQKDHTLVVFNELKNEIIVTVSVAMDAKVDSLSDSTKVIESLQLFAELKKRVDKVRRSVVDPLNKRIRVINDYVSDFMGPLAEAEEHMRSELNRFAAEQEKIRQMELEKARAKREQELDELRSKQYEEKKLAIEAAATFGDDPEDLTEKHEIETSIAEIETKAKIWDANQLQIKNTRRTTKVRVLDINLVPKVFLKISVDEKMAIAAYKNGTKQIDGLEFFEEVSVAIGEKTRVTREALEYK